MLTLYESNELDKIQNEAARIVTGSTKLASIDSLYTETGWETLGSRRKTHKLTTLYKMKNGLCPDYLASLVSATIGSASTYPLLNLQTYKHYIRFLVFTIHISCLLLSVIGVKFQSKLRILQALTSSKTV